MILYELEFEYNLLNKSDIFASAFLIIAKDNLFISNAFLKEDENIEVLNLFLVNSDHSESVWKDKLLIESYKLLKLLVVEADNKH